MNAKKVFNSLYDECYRIIHEISRENIDAQTKKFIRIKSIMRRLNMAYCLNEIVDFEHMDNLFFNNAYIKCK